VFESYRARPWRYQGSLLDRGETKNFLCTLFQDQFQRSLPPASSRVPFQSEPIAIHVMNGQNSQNTHFLHVPLTPSGARSVCVRPSGGWSAMCASIADSPQAVGHKAFGDASQRYASASSSHLWQASWSEACEGRFSPRSSPIYRRRACGAATPSGGRCVNLHVRPGPVSSTPFPSLTLAVRHY
jgi:hypothetical protein